MKLIDNSKLEDQLAYISELSSNKGGFRAADVSLANFEMGGIVYLARSLEKSLKKVNGALLIEGVDRLMVLTENTPAHDLATFCADFSCVITEMDSTPEQLKNISSRLEKAAGRNPAGRKSTLFKHRAARDRNLTMVIDDDEFLCTTMQSALKRYGACVGAQTVEGGLDAYMRHSPDCVFLDLHLEGGSGLDLLDSILSYDPDAYVIMLTSDSSASQAVAAKKHGVISFVSKPLVINRVEYELFRSPTFRRYKGEHSTDD